MLRLVLRFIFILMGFFGWLGFFCLFGFGFWLKVVDLVFTQVNTLEIIIHRRKFEKPINS